MEGKIIVFTTKSLINEFNYDSISHNEGWINQIFGLDYLHSYIGENATIIKDKPKKFLNTINHLKQDYNLTIEDIFIANKPFYKINIENFKKSLEKKKKNKNSCYKKIS